MIVGVGCVMVKQKVYLLVGWVEGLDARGTENFAMGVARSGNRLRNDDQGAGLSISGGEPVTKIRHRHASLKIRSEPYREGVTRPSHT
jgi:hypothetical protein